MKWFKKINFFLDFNLKRRDSESLSLINPDLVKRYCSQKAFQCFSIESISGSFWNLMPSSIP
ncbi:hypothetical protein EPICR_50213 [Candidatus Desulfarcum epimagneticum]|uniref:Uncharacterized protein n=1 Tax=uncultured Desulfobacteraceae bacterium TaxID=218296 RepID=A0A484HIF8_9BACT|nr:hypothetical protein EPICR_50213 [uncultured Desulfobacteraceae bacterium]